MLGNQYVEQIIGYIRSVEQAEAESVGQAAAWIADSIAEDGVLHLFGCGHSHILVEDFFYRAGGLVPVNPILETSVMLHEGAVKSSKIERMEGYAGNIIDNYEIRPGEVIIVISNSGVNGIPVEMAMEAKARGLKVVAITSKAYYGNESRHSSGKKLGDVADLVIDNHLPSGDALVEVPGGEGRMSPGSTIIGAVILHLITTAVAERLAERGIEPPIFTSGNVPGGFERNQRYIDQYRKRIKHL